MNGDFPFWYHCCCHHQVYQWVPGHSIATTPGSCLWYKDEGNESYAFFTSCGAQIDYDRDWWKHCPKCGKSILRPTDTTCAGIIAGTGCSCGQHRPAETQEVKHD